MFGLKLSSTFWALLAAVALFATACSTGGGETKKEPPTPTAMLAHQPTPTGSAFTYDNKNSGDGTTAAKAVVYKTSLLKAKSKVNASGLRDLAKLFTGLKGTPTYTVTNDADNTTVAVTGTVGTLPTPTAAADLLVQITGSENANALYLKLKIESIAPEVITFTTTSGVQVESVPGEPYQARVTVPADRQVSLAQLLPVDYPLSTAVTWTLETSSTDKILRAKSITGCGTDPVEKNATSVDVAARGLANDASLAGSLVKEADNLYQLWDNAATKAKAAGSVNLKAAVVAGTDHPAQDYSFAVTFSNEATSVDVATSADPGVQGLAFDKSSGNDGSTEAKAVVVKHHEASQPDTAIPITKTGNAVNKFDLAQLVKNDEDLKLEYATVTDGTTKALTNADTTKDGFQYTPSAGEVVIRVQVKGSSTAFFFKLSFRDALVLGAAETALQGAETDPQVATALGSFTVKTVASVDVADQFDFAYLLTYLPSTGNPFDISASLSNTATPGNLPPSLAGGKYKLVVTATGKSSSSAYSGVVEEKTFFFKLAPISATTHLQLGLPQGSTLVEDKNVAAHLAAGATLGAFTLRTKAAQPVDVAASYTYTLSKEPGNTNASWDAGLTNSPKALPTSLEKVSTYKLVVVATPTETEAYTNTVTGTYYFKVLYTLTLSPATNSNLVTDVGSAKELKVGAERDFGAFALKNDASPAADVDATYVYTLTKQGTGTTWDEVDWVNSGGTTKDPDLLPSPFSAGTYKLDVVAIPSTNPGDYVDGQATGTYFFKIPARLSLAGYKVKAKGVAAATVPTQAAISASADIAAVTVSTTSPVSLTAATATLALTTAATAGQKVAFNNFVVTDADGVDVTTEKDANGVAVTNVTIAGAAGAGAATNVAASGDAVATATTAVPLTLTARADFAASATADGKVLLKVTDKFGQIGWITVTLDDGV